MVTKLINCELKIVARFYTIFLEGDSIWSWSVNDIKIRGIYTRILFKARNKSSAEIYICQQT